MDERFCALYPFSREAREYLKDQKVSLEEVVTDPAYDMVRDAGKRRVLEAVERAEISEHSMVDENEYFIEALSYVVARMIVSSVADPFLVKRYALAEAVTMHKRLLNEERDTVLDIAREIGMDTPEPAGDGITLHFSEFLKYATTMRSKEWKLVNQDVRDGNVLLDQKRFCRLVQGALQVKIESELPLPIDDLISEGFGKIVREINEENAKKRAELMDSSDMGRISITRFPPCMTEFLRMTREGINIPHSGRFAMVTFLHTIGMDNDEIVKVFALSPDFNERMTRYQVDHVTGFSSGIEYTPPECATMKSYGICINPDNLCNKEWMKHPLTYYRIKGKKKDKKPRKGPSKPGQTSEGQ